jgi:hypothetical protein
MDSLILGPQAPITNSYFDQTQIAMAKKLGASCPPTPPTDPAALNNYQLHLQYYDLPKSLYIVHRRTGDPAIQRDARNGADSWWQHPWIGKGLARPWPDNASPPPRHAGIGGLILRALDGKPEYWDFCVAYTKAFLNIYHLWRLNNAKLHVDIREGAFTFHDAVWLAHVLPDSYPLQSGGMATNGAAIRAQFHADLEKITISYYERLQRSSPCGNCWLYDADLQDEATVKLVAAAPVGATSLLRALRLGHRSAKRHSAIRLADWRRHLRCDHRHSAGLHRGFHSA